jgi:hypothetical protein
MIPAISPRGDVAFRMVDGTINADRFIDFLAALIEGARRTIILVMDNLRVHYAEIAPGWPIRPAASNSHSCRPTTRKPIPTST